MNIVTVDFDKPEGLQKYCKCRGYTLQNNNEYENFPKENSLLLYKDTCDTYGIDIYNKNNFNSIINLAGNAKEIVFHGIKDKIILSSSYKKESKKPILDEKVIKNIIQPGYPYRSDDTLFLNKEYFYHLIHKPSLSIYDQNLFTIMPNKIPASITSSVTTSIPKIIHQSFSNRALSEGMIHAVHTWININKEYEYRFYDNKDRREFIETYFDKDVLKAYDMLIPGAYQCDLWRYCVIYVHGGIYADIKNGAVYPIHDFLRPDVDYFFINDSDYHGVFNACFGAKPKSPLIYKLIMLVVQRILNKEYGYHCLYPTGPLAMGEIIFNAFGFKNSMPTGTYKVGEDTVCIYNHYLLVFLENGSIRLNNKNKPIIYTRHNKDVNKGIQTITGNPHYSILWKKKKIYRDI